MKIIFVNLLLTLALGQVVAQSLLNLMEEADCDIERERTFIMIKPDGVQRGLIGEIIQRFERKGFKLVALKLLRVILTILRTVRVFNKNSFRLTKIFYWTTIRNYQINRFSMTW